MKIKQITLSCCFLFFIACTQSEHDEQKNRVKEKRTDTFLENRQQKPDTKLLTPINKVTKSEVHMNSQEIAFEKENFFYMLNIAIGVMNDQILDEEDIKKWEKEGIWIEEDIQKNGSKRYILTKSKVTLMIPQNFQKDPFLTLYFDTTYNLSNFISEKDFERQKIIKLQKIETKYRIYNSNYSNKPTLHTSFKYSSIIHSNVIMEFEVFDEHIRKMQLNYPKGFSIIYIYKDIYHNGDNPIGSKLYPS